MYTNIIRWIIKFNKFVKGGHCGDTGGGHCN